MSDHQNHAHPSKQKKDKATSLLITALLVMALLWMVNDLRREQIPTPQETPKPTATHIIPVGLAFTESFASVPRSEGDTYVIPNFLPNGKFALEGKWRFTDVSAVLTDTSGKAKLNFTAKKVFLAASSTKPTSIQVMTSNAPTKTLVIENPGRYEIYSSENLKEDVLEISFPDAGVEFYEFSFE